jgi:hypothetical protein
MKDDLQEGNDTKQIIIFARNLHSASVHHSGDRLKWAANCKFATSVIFI